MWKDRDIFLQDGSAFPIFNPVQRYEAKRLDFSNFRFKTKGLDATLIGKNAKSPDWSAVISILPL